jgi:hypothetical protein
MVDVHESPCILVIGIMEDNFGNWHMIFFAKTRG